jgi:hypothetical protein
MKIFKLLWLPLLLTLFILTSCSDDDEGPIVLPPIEYENAFIDLFNYYDEGTVVSWYVDEALLEADQKFAFGAKREFEFDSNDKTIKLKAEDKNANVLVEWTPKVEEGKLYYSSVTGPSGETKLIFGECDETAPAADHVRIRFIHSYSGVDAIDVYLGGETDEYKVVSNLEYTFLSQYIEVKHDELDVLLVCTPVGVDPDPDTDLYRTVLNGEHDNNAIHNDVFAKRRNSSEMQLYITPQ